MQGKSSAMRIKIQKHRNYSKMAAKSLKVSGYQKLIFLFEFTVFQ